MNKFKNCFEINGDLLLNYCNLGDLNMIKTLVKELKTPKYNNSYMDYIYICSCYRCTNFHNDHDDNEFFLSDFWIPLCISIRHGFNDIVKFFIENYEFYNYTIPFRLAVKCGHLNIIKTLFTAKDFYINNDDPFCHDLMLKTFENYELQIAIFIVKNYRKLDIPRMLLIEYFIKNNKIGMLKILIKNELDFNCNIDYLIIRAVYYNNIKLAKVFIKSGADVNVDDNYAIRKASKRGNFKMVKFLVKNGADVTANDNYAIRKASEKGYLKLVKFLVKSGADVTANDNEAVYNASCNNNIETVKYLIQNGADIAGHEFKTIANLLKYGHINFAKKLINKLDN